MICDSCHVLFLKTGVDDQEVYYYESGGKAWAKSRLCPVCRAFAEMDSKKEDDDES